MANEALKGEVAVVAGEYAAHGRDQDDATPRRLFGEIQQELRRRFVPADVGERSRDHVRVTALQAANPRLSGHGRCAGSHPRASCDLRVE